MLCPAFPFLSLSITPECPMAWLLLQEQEQGQEEEGWVTALTALAVQAAGHSGDLEEGCRKGNAMHIDTTSSHAACPAPPGTSTITSLSSGVLGAKLYTKSYIIPLHSSHS